jgi:hypothetical protein
LPWAPGPRQELVDALAEAEIRDLEAKTTREDRREDAEIAFLEAQTRKIAGEVAQQPQEEEERETRIIRDWVLLLLPSLLFAISVITGAVDSGALVGNGFDLIGEKVWVLPRLLEGG